MEDQTMDGKELNKIIAADKRAIKILQNKLKSTDDRKERKVRTAELNAAQAKLNLKIKKLRGGK